jgi:hypothetical protein
MTISPEMVDYVRTTALHSSISEQATQLDVSPRTIKRIRTMLIKSGTLPNQRREWTENDDEELIDALRWGLSLFKAAKRLKRTPQSVRRRAERLGGILAIRCGIEAIETISAVRSIRQVAFLLGMQRATLTRLCQMGVIKYNRAGYTQPKGRKRNWQYFISDDSLMKFLEEYHFSFLVPLEQITDPDWREYARLARKDQPGYWMPASDIAQQIGYTKAEGARWCNQGRINAMYFMKQWYIWSEDAAPLMESKTAPSKD